MREVFGSGNGAEQSVAQMAMVSPFQGYLVSSEAGKLPEQMDAAWCSGNFFSLLGVQPVLGRGFTVEDDTPGATATAILSASFWKRRYGADPSIVGKTIWLDAKPFMIIGVLPPWFVYSGAFGGNTVQVWTPVRHEAPAYLMQTYGDHEFQVVARLAPGVTLAALESRLVALQKQIKAAHPDPAVHPGAIGRTMLDDAVHDYKTPLYALLAATGCVLLIACMNVAGLLVARAASRNKELAIRAALGGGRLRLMRERLIESLLLSAAGGAVGLLTGVGRARVAHPYPPRHESRGGDPHRRRRRRVYGGHYPAVRAFLGVDLGNQRRHEKCAGGIARGIALAQRRHRARHAAAHAARR